MLRDEALLAVAEEKGHRLGGSVAVEVDVEAEAVVASLNVHVVDRDKLSAGAELKIQCLAGVYIVHQDPSAPAVGVVSALADGVHLRLLDDDIVRLTTAVVDDSRDGCCVAHGHVGRAVAADEDRTSTCLNSIHVALSQAV